LREQPVDLKQLEQSEVEFPAIDNH
jgi:hypothetical protein